MTHYVVRANPVEDHEDSRVHHVVRVNPHIQEGTTTATVQQFVASVLNQAGLITSRTRFRETSRGALQVTGIDPYLLVKDHAALAKIQRYARSIGYRLEPGAGALLLTPEPEFSAMARPNPRRRRNPTDAQVRERFDRCVIDVQARGGAYNPEAICAASMRKAYGSQFQRIAAEGRSLAAAGRHARGMVRSRATGRLERRTGSRLRRTAVQRRGIVGRVAREQVTARRRAMIGERDVMRAVANPRGTYNETNVEELMLYAVNDEPTYRHAQAIMRNMVAKQRRGTYVPQLAVKAWLHWADGAAKRYAHENARPADWSRIFSTADRHEAAKRAVDYYAEEMHDMAAKTARSNPAQYGPKRPRFYLEREPLDSGGYTRQGQYFGRGAPLFRFSSDGAVDTRGRDTGYVSSYVEPALEGVRYRDGYVDAHLRAADRKAAMAKILKVFPTARFYGRE